VSAANQANELRAYYLGPSSGVNLGLALLAEDAASPMPKADSPAR